MDWDDNVEQAAFRAEVRSLIETEMPERYQRGEGGWEEDRKSEDAGERKAARGARRPVCAPWATRRRAHPYGERGQAPPPPPCAASRFARAAGCGGIQSEPGTVPIGRVPL